MVPGNALVTHVSWWGGWFIEKATGFRATHTACLYSPDMIAEAVACGVRKLPLADFLKAPDWVAIVEPLYLPALGGIEVGRKFLDRCVREGRGYDWPAALTWPLQWIERPGWFQCAELVLAWWDMILRDVWEWPLSVERFYIPCPGDVARLGKIVWSSDDKRTEVMLTNAVRKHERRLKAARRR